MQAEGGRKEENQTRMSSWSDRQSSMVTVSGWFGARTVEWGFWADARNERRPRIGSLCERRGRHVTRSSCRLCRHPPALPLEGSKNLPAALSL